MSDVTERLDRVEERVDTVADSVGVLRGEVGELRGEVGELRGEVGELRGEVGGLRGEVGDLRGEVGGLRGEVGGLRGDVGELEKKTNALAAEVQKLRVLGEENTRQIQIVAEVQARHGDKLDGLEKDMAALQKAVEPIAAIHAFITSVAGNHETRITALEDHVGMPQIPRR